MFFSFDLGDDNHNDCEKREEPMNTESADGMTPVSTNSNSNQLYEESLIRGDNCNSTGNEGITAISPMLSTGYDNSAATSTSINGEEARASPNNSECSFSSYMGLCVDLVTENRQRNSISVNRVNTSEIVGGNANVNLVLHEDDVNTTFPRWNNGTMDPFNSPIFWEPLQFPGIQLGIRQPRTNLSRNDKKKILTLCKEYQNAFPKMNLMEIAKMIHGIDYPHIPERAIRNVIYKYRNDRKRVYQKK